MSNPLTVIKNLGSGKSEVKGVVKRDWVPRGASISPPISTAIATQTNQVNLSCS
jgi:hypothetical protein